MSIVPVRGDLAEKWRRGVWGGFRARVWIGDGCRRGASDVGGGSGVAPTGVI